MAKNSLMRRELPEPLAYSVTDAARVAGLGRSTLYELMVRGQLAYVKIRSRRLIRREELEGLLERHRAQPNRRKSAFGAAEPIEEVIQKHEPNAARGERS